eukprot:TRINITY_DN10981_c0_g1_i2.p1 TRINITY_DN10981_c0_g1~~TRINITY_DN10981_c0_g1_i2.p1  ORF type:complete len:200 (-),score=26.70 TRINITY_DN10981_c0_g1_i2:157-756(-)
MFAVSIIYCREGESNPLKMMKTKEFSSHLNSFLEYMHIFTGPPPSGSENKSTLLETNWMNKIVNIYLSTQLNSEECRRLIGNCQAVIFFVEPSEVPFDLSQLDTMGGMPQCYFVIQPYQDVYRLAFIYRNKLTKFEPIIPCNVCLGKQSIRHVILTKLYNGYMVARTVPPISKLYEAPRQDSITTLAKEYIPKTWFKKK